MWDAVAPFPMHKITPYLYSIATTAGIIGVAACFSHLLLDTPRAHRYIPTSGPLAEKNAQVVLDNKCAACHGRNTEYNSLMNFLSFGQIRRDIEAAQRAFVIGGDPSVRSGIVDYVKMDKVLRTRRMPPARYSAVHLGSRLTPDDIAILRARYKEDAAMVRRFAPIAPAAEPQTDIEKFRIYLGHKLYTDTRLSTTNEVSCASCHDLTRGGTDNKPKSEGVPGPDGKPQLGGVNAPTVYNAAGNIRQFWDGRAADLKEQAGGPPLNPVEMGYAHPDDWAKIAEKLAQDPELVSLFALVYGDKGITGDTITDAIAAFEKTLATPGSDFDRYLRGDKGAMDAEQVKGLNAFVNHGCATCHSGPALGGLSFECVHTHAPFHAHMPKGYVEGAHGLADFTKNEAHRDMFRVPTLRNVALTYPYFHTGAIDRLEDAVRIMFDTEVGTKVSDSTVKAVTRFLEAQTGTYRGKKLDTLTPEDVKPGEAPKTGQQQGK